MVNTRGLARRFDRLRGTAILLESTYSDIGQFHYSCEYLRNTINPIPDSVPNGWDFFVTEDGQQLLFHIQNAGGGLYGTQVDFATLSEYWSFVQRFITALDDLAGEIPVQKERGEF